MSTEPLWVARARELVGLREIVGTQHEPKVVQFFRDAGVPEIKDDETAWCGAFVQAMLVAAGLDVRPPGDRYNSLRAREWLNVGENVRFPKVGDIAVFSRGDPSGTAGHVAFFLADRGDYIEVIGGNQSNSVSIARYAKDRLLGYRRLPQAATTQVPARPSPPPVPNPVPAPGTDLVTRVGTGGAVATSGGFLVVAGAWIWNALGWVGLVAFVVLVIFLLWSLRRPLGRLLFRNYRPPPGASSLSAAALPGRPVRRFLMGRLRDWLGRATDFLIQPGGRTTNPQTGQIDETPKGVLRSKSILAILGLMVQDAFTFDWSAVDFSSRAASWQTAVTLWARFGLYIGAIWWRMTSTVPTTGPAAPGA